MSGSPTILIIDDDQAVCASIRLLLKKSGYDSMGLQHPRELPEALTEYQPSLIILDMNFTISTSGRQGLETLKMLRETLPNVPVILITGWATVELAVKGMKMGAGDFIAKPWDNKQLIGSVKTLLALQQDKTDHSGGAEDYFSRIIGKDPELQNLLSTARRVAATDASVLITGESGTGKELLAEAIHYTSARADKPFVKVNLGGISTSLFESELFGHKRGAFTDAIADRQGRFAVAEGGTIFLDEIGDLAAPSQVKLLRVLQERTYEILGSSKPQQVDVRVISATNRDLEVMVIDGTFREDLYYRINLIRLNIPPLRQRPNDIPLLASHFLENIQALYERPGLRFTSEAREWLRRQTFPGNIRQLKNLVERTAILQNDQNIRAEDLARHYRSPVQTATLPKVGELTLEEMEVQMIRRALQFHAGNITEVAKSLGITRSALYRRLEKYGIS